MNSSALATIKEISDGILMKSRLPEAEAVIIDQLTRDGYRELNIHVLSEGRVVTLETMDSNLIISFPDDLIELKDVYVPKDNLIWSLTRNTAIPMITQTVDEVTTIPEDWGEGGDIPAGEGIWFQTRGGRNNKGYYTVDTANRRILFRNVDRSEVMLDYISTGISSTAVTYVPISAKMALENYVMKELAAFGIVNTNLYPLYEQRFSKELAKLRMIDFNFTAFTDATYRTMVTSVQR